MVTEPRKSPLTATSLSLRRRTTTVKTWPSRAVVGAATSIRASSGTTVTVAVATSSLGSESPDTGSTVAVRTRTSPGAADGSTVTRICGLAPSAGEVQCTVRVATETVH